MEAGGEVEVRGGIGLHRCRRRRCVFLRREGICSAVGMRPERCWCGSLIRPPVRCVCFLFYVGLGGVGGVVGGGGGHDVLEFVFKRLFKGRNLRAFGSR